MDIRLCTALLLGWLLAITAAGVHAQEPLSISGRVWEDRNADGRIQEGEPGLPLEVILRGPGREETVVAAADGSYTFSNLAPGAYQVRVGFAESSFYLTSPTRLASGPYEIGLSLDYTPITALNFGLHGSLNLPTFTGLAWKNAARVPNPRVQAFIGDTNCTGPGGLRPTDQDPASYLISVASAALLPGCGEPGDTIRFTINGEPANETVTWEVVELPEPSAPGGTGPIPPPGAPPGPTNRHELNLTIGPPFAWWYPVVEPFEQAFEDQTLYVEAFINGTQCGRVDRPGMPGALLAVASAELKPGCGEEGSTVSFAIKGTPVSEQPSGEQAIRQSCASPSRTMTPPPW